MIGAILAGGAGRRMGGNKPAAMLGGRPLLAWPIDVVREAGLEPVVVAKPGTPLPAVDARVIRESEAVAHPLAGVLAALDAAGGAPAVVVAADMPFLTACVVRRLAETPGAVVVAAGAGGLEPLCARYGPEVRGALAGALAARAALRPTVAGLAPVRVAVEPEVLVNVNSPEELRAAEARLASRRTPTRPPRASRSGPPPSGGP